MAPLDSPKQLLNASDLRDIFADALTSFSPLATLVGANAARSSNHGVTNVKQTILANIAPIGALGMMATVCKGSELLGVKDMLGVANADVYDAAADLGCFVLFGIARQLRERVGFSCRHHGFALGVSACAIVKQLWKSDTKFEDGQRQKGKEREKRKEGQDSSPNFEKIGLVAKNFRGGTVIGRMVWECTDATDYQKKIEQVHTAITSGFGNNIYENSDQTDMAVFARVDIVSGGVGMLELLASSCDVAVITTSPLLGWQSPLASAFLFGGQIILTLGHTLVHVLFRRLRRQTTITIPIRDVAKTWTLVDGSWFVSALTRRPTSLAASGKSHITLGQHTSFKRPYFPRVQALLGLLIIAGGFIMFYIGARSSDFRTVLIYILVFLVVNCTKGFLINRANRCYHTITNNFGYLLMNRRSYETQSKNGKSEEISIMYRGSKISVVLHEDDKNVLHRQDSGPVPIPRKPSRSTLIRRHATNRYSMVTTEDGLSVATQALLPSSSQQGPQEHIQLKSLASTTSLLFYTRQLPFYDVESQYFSHSPNLNPLAIPLPPSMISLAPTKPTLNFEDHSRERAAVDTKYRVYAKVAVRHREAIGMFYYSRPEDWAMAAHVVFDVVRRERPSLWGDPMTREYLCQIPFEFILPPLPFDQSVSAHSELDIGIDAQGDFSAGTRTSSIEKLRESNRVEPLPPVAGVSTSTATQTSTITAMLYLALDETRFEDLFWSAGQEITSIIMEHFIHLTQLPSESRRATDLSVLCTFVYILTKMLLTSEGKHGSRSLMRAIDLARARRPYDDSIWLVGHLRQAAENAAMDVTEQNPNDLSLGPAAGFG
ncbi:hypothetical protein K435DRAFT_854615 [Dendrothele bispora CBS 962.96]|uniref:Uncharacterized protein n=1 Tax=Dendrothele bispora (strain CBS 962.96) TaxID=1314807 RepID=A0A4S8MEK2_DENBC|nr:hypothetical protein K435DRAFT_854615 [Dendrothele bispora CBS 962.96]